MTALLGMSPHQFEKQAPPLHTMKAFQLMRPLQKRPGIQGVPPELANTNYFKALDLFRRYDANRSMSLDRKEFQTLMRALDPSRNDYEAIDALFINEVDKDRRGEVSLPRFLQWVFCSQGMGGVDDKFLPDLPTPGSPGSSFQAKRPSSRGGSEPRSSGLRRSSSTVSMTHKESGHQPVPLAATVGAMTLRKQSSTSSLTSALGGGDVGALRRLDSRTSLGSTTGASGERRPVPEERRLQLRIIHDPSYTVQVIGVAKALDNHGAPVEVKCTSSSAVKGVKSAIISIGNGIKLWDWDTMLAHYEYPFRTVDAANAWVADLAKVHIPVLMQVARLVNQPRLH